MQNFCFFRRPVCHKHGLHVQNKVLKEFVLRNVRSESESYIKRKGGAGKPANTFMAVTTLHTLGIDIGSTTVESCGSLSHAGAALF